MIHELRLLRISFDPEPTSTRHDRHAEGMFDPLEILIASTEQLFQAILAAVDTYRNQKQWHALIRRGMRKDFSWDATADAYEQLYQKAVGLAPL